MERVQEDANKLCAQYVTAMLNKAFVCRVSEHRAIEAII